MSLADYNARMLAQGETTTPEDIQQMKKIMKMRVEKELRKKYGDPNSSLYTDPDRDILMEQERYWRMAQINEGRWNPRTGQWESSVRKSI